MFCFSIVFAGKIKNPHINKLYLDYQKRISRYGKINFIQISPGSKKEEGMRILNVLDRRNNSKVFVLSEEGELYSSKAFSKLLNFSHGQHLIFVVGGAYGLEEEVKTRANHLISLSLMTFTHELSILLLAEQVYRGISIINGSKYHHD